MSPVLALLRSGRRAIIAHGIEVWKRLDLITRLGARFATEFWCVSKFTATQLRRYNALSRTTAYLLPNALEDDPPSVEFPEDQPPTLLSVCRLEGSERYKGVDLALRAHALLLKEKPELRFHVVGDGTDVDRLRWLVSDLGTGDRVTFLGRLPASDLAREYEQCTAFVLPSRREGFGIVFLEAMARGKPVVAFRCGGTPEVVLDGECGMLAEADDLLGLYDALRSLLRDGELRARLGRSGRQRVAALFTPQAFMRRVHELLTAQTRPLPSGEVA
jgi:glycosyltransferase involved in cell wall biosynthesis